MTILLSSRYRNIQIASRSGWCWLSRSGIKSSLTAGAFKKKLFHVCPTGAMSATFTEAARNL